MWRNCRPRSLSFSVASPRRNSSLNFLKNATLSAPLWESGDEIFYTRRVVASQVTLMMLLISSLVFELVMLSIFSPECEPAARPARMGFFRFFPKNTPSPSKVGTERGHWSEKVVGVWGLDLVSFFLALVTGEKTTRLMTEQESVVAAVAVPQPRPELHLMWWGVDRNPTWRTNCGRESRKLVLQTGKKGDTYHDKVGMISYAERWTE